MDATDNLHIDLRNTITDEIAVILGFSKQGVARKFLAILARKPSDQFAKLASAFDERVSSLGFSQAAEWISLRFTRGLITYGQERIPRSGPLLIGSNHPGNIDALAIAASSMRDDLKIVVSSIPFVQSLPATSKHMIWSSMDTHLSMLVVRSIINELRAGQAVLIFPSGTVDPDPDCMPGAFKAITSWSPSLELILRKVPETQFVGTIVSGVMDIDLLDHPLIRLRRCMRDRQKIAELLHVIRGVFNSERISTTTRVSFSQPCLASEFPQERGALLNAIIRNAQSLLTLHSRSAI